MSPCQHAHSRLRRAGRGGATPRPRARRSRAPTLGHHSAARYTTQRETGDRRIGWGRDTFRSQVSAISFLVQVFRYRSWSGRKAFSPPPNLICHRFSHPLSPLIPPYTRYSILYTLILPTPTPNLNSALHSVLHSVLNAVLHSSHPHFTVATSPRRSSTVPLCELPVSSVTPTFSLSGPTLYPSAERSLTPRSRLS